MTFKLSVNGHSSSDVATVVEPLGVVSSFNSDYNPGQLHFGDIEHNAQCYLEMDPLILFEVE